MPIPTAAGVPSHSGNLTPNLYSQKILYKFYTGTVLSSIANTEYEEELFNYGDEITIRTTPDIEIHDYIDGQPLEFQRPQVEIVKLKIDQAKYWAFSTTSIGRKQSDLDYPTDWTDDAARNLDIAIDKDVLSAIVVDASPFNRGATAGKLSQSFDFGVTGTPIALGTGNALDIIFDFGAVLDEQDVPAEGRWTVWPAWAINKLRKSDLRDRDFNDGLSPTRSGRVGVINEFTVYRSNNIVPVLDGSTKVYNILFGQMTALSFALQITEAAKTDDPDGFGDRFKGFSGYGFEVLKPDALGVFYASVG